MNLCNHSATNSKNILGVSLSKIQKQKKKKTEENNIFP
jgi:hypothetical protein